MSKTTIFFSIVSLAVESFAAGEGCIVVADGVVHLRDIAPPEMPLGGELGQDRGAEVVFAAPSGGATRYLGSEERSRLLRDRGFESTSGGLCIRSETHRLVAGEVHQALLTAFAKSTDFASLKVKVEVVDWSRIPIPAGMIEFSLSMLPRLNDGRAVIWRGSVRPVAGRSVPIWVKARLVVERTAVVAARSLASGHRLEDGDVAVEVRDLFPTRQFLDGSISAELSGRVLRRPLQAGDILSPQDLSTPLAVQTGQHLTAELLDGLIHLKVDAIAETSGREGDWIWLRGTSGNYRFRGKVLNPHEVQIAPDAPRVKRNSREEIAQ